jgi:hypothetical protein
MLGNTLMMGVSNKQRLPRKITLPQGTRRRFAQCIATQMYAADFSHRCCRFVTALKHDAYDVAGIMEETPGKGRETPQATDSVPPSARTTGTPLQRRRAPIPRSTR